MIKLLPISLKKPVLGRDLQTIFTNLCKNSDLGYKIELFPGRQKFQILAFYTSPRDGGPGQADLELTMTLLVEGAETTSIICYERKYRNMVIVVQTDFPKPVCVCPERSTDNPRVVEENERLMKLATNFWNQLGAALKKT